MATARVQHGGHYEMRAASFTTPSPFKEETSWLLANSSKAMCDVPPPAPTITGINYAPSVLVQLREQRGAAWSAGDTVGYFEASNSTIAYISTPPRPVSAERFYLGLLALQRARDTALAGAMTARLPGNDGQRQHGHGRTSGSYHNLWVTS